MHLGQSGFVPTGRKQLANPRDGVPRALPAAAERAPRALGQSSLCAPALRTKFRPCSQPPMSYLNPGMRERAGH
jgi:hypothetical protein